MNCKNQISVEEAERLTRQKFACAKCNIEKEKENNKRENSFTKQQNEILEEFSKIIFF